MRFRIVIAAQPGWQHAGMYRELAETLVYAFGRLGYRADIAFNEFASGAQNILLHAHELGEQYALRMPDTTVILNLEQVDTTLFDWAPRLRHFLLNYEVWDYSRQNVERLKTLVPRIHLLPIGTEPEMTRISPAPVQDIDVLFYGTPSERRMRVIEKLRNSRVNVHFAFGVYGAERDALIQRSKVVLNLHHTDAQVFEIVRVSYLLANRKAVVSELSQASDIEPDLQDAVLGVPYDGIVAACRSLLADKGKRRALEQRGFKRMTARRQSAFLKELIATRGQS
jgi:hypothetical protein